MKNTEARHNIRKRWLSLLFEFGHIEFQNRLWINDRHPEIEGSHSETICEYFDDLVLDDGYDFFIKNGVIEVAEYDIIAAFHQRLESYTNNVKKKDLPDSQILEDQEWLALISIAQVNWGKLKSVIQDKRELDYMYELERKYSHQI